MSINLISVDTQGEFVDSRILVTIMSNANIGLKDLSMGCLLQETNKVVFDQCEVSSGNITDSGQQDSISGITSGYCNRVLSGEGRVPKLEKVSDLGFDDLHFSSLGHDRRMVLGDLPLAFLEEVDEGVTSLNLLSINSHGELVNSGILGPVGSYNDISIKNLFLGLKLADVGEVINTSWVVGTWNIQDIGEKNSVVGISVSNLERILSGKRIVPKVENSSEIELLMLSFDILYILPDLRTQVEQHAFPSQVKLHKLLKIIFWQLDTFLNLIPFCPQQSISSNSKY